MDKLEPQQSWIVSRPRAVLMSLPLAERWEVTRRHPYYQLCWRIAHARLLETLKDSLQRRTGELAALILANIGIGGDPPPPSASPDSLGMNQLGQGWLSGAVAPPTIRGLIALVLTSLPPELRSEIGKFFTAAPPGDHSAPSHPYERLKGLFELKHPVLDSSPASQIIGINIDAPQREIVNSVEQLVRVWKKERGINERRRRPEKLEHYLAVWDRREGWVRDHYESEAEKTLPEIAKDLRLSISTVANRYRCAFRLIVGHDYNSELWEKAMGFLKISEILNSAETAAKAVGRLRRRPSRQPIPETTLASTALLTMLAVTRTDNKDVDLAIDISRLIREGYSNQEIISRTGLTSPRASDLIDHFRMRQQDGL